MCAGTQTCMCSVSLFHDRIPCLKKKLMHMHTHIGAHMHTRVCVRAHTCAHTRRHAYTCTQIDHAEKEILHGKKSATRWKSKGKTCLWFLHDVYGTDSEKLDKGKTKDDIHEEACWYLFLCSHLYYNTKIIQEDMFSRRYVLDKYDPWIQWPSHILTLKEL